MEMAETSPYRCSMVYKPCQILHVATEITLGVISMPLSFMYGRVLNGWILLLQIILGPSAAAQPTVIFSI